MKHRSLAPVAYAFRKANTRSRDSCQRETRPWLLTVFAQCEGLFTIRFFCPDEDRRPFRLRLGLRSMLQSAVRRMLGLRLFLARQVERHGSADKFLQSRFVYQFIFVDIDRAPDLSIEAGLNREDRSSNAAPLAKVSRRFCVSRQYRRCVLRPPRQCRDTCRVIITKSLQLNQARKQLQLHSSQAGHLNST